MFKVYRERTSKVVAEQREQLQTQGESMQKMEEELTHGKHEERRFFELAELQVIAFFQRITSCVI